MYYSLLQCCHATMTVTLEKSRKFSNYRKIIGSNVPSHSIFYKNFFKCNQVLIRLSNFSVNEFLAVLNNQNNNRPSLNIFVNVMVIRIRHTYILTIGREFWSYGQCFLVK